MPAFPRWRFKPQQSSFVTPVTIPSSDPDEGEMVTVCFSYEWLPYVLGALSQLQQMGTWQGNQTEQIEAVGLATNLISLFDTPICTVPAPYWDEESADDADDTAPETDQPWYGIIFDSGSGLEWKEQVGLWAITAFVALAATPATAIAFYPIARRFTIAAKKHDLGGIIRAFVDSTEIGQMDTYSAEDGVAEMSIVMPDSMGFTAETVHSFWLVMSEDVNPAVEGAPNIQILRKRLTESEVSGDPTKIRYNSDCACIQTSPDGGSTWVANPQADPRYGTSYTKPPLGGGTAQCDSAANRVKWVHDFIDQVVAGLERLGDAFVVANIALGFFELLFAEAGVLVDVFFEFGSVAVSAGASAIDGAFDSTVYDALLCLFYCDSLSDGSYNETHFNQLVADVDASPDINSTARLILDAIFNAQGWNGVNNAGVIGGQTGDCSDCACQWCYEWDFLASDGGFTALSGNGTWVSGQGWQTHVQNDSCGDHAYLYLSKMLGLTTDQIGTVEIDFSRGWSTPAADFLDVYLSGTLTNRYTMSADGLKQHWAYNPPTQDIDQLGLTFNECGQGAAMYATKVRVKGFGDMPAFTGGAVCP